jgi:diguanylate cyclase (GGDEF)-like protein
MRARWSGLSVCNTAGEIAREALEDVETRLQSIINNVPGYVFRRILRADGTLGAPYFGPLVRIIMGAGEADVLTAADFYRRVHPDDQDRLQAAIQQSGADLARFDEEFRFLSSSGDMYWFRSISQPRRMSNGDIIWDGFGLDITDEKTAKVEAAFLALHDSLTGLSNRTRFEASLRSAIASLAILPASLSVLSVDLDSFQDVNSTLGQSAGDEVLRIVARRLQTLAGETGIVARLGGDEFVLLMDIVSPPQSVASISSLICADIARPMRVAGRDIVVQACVGATTVLVSPGLLEDAFPILCREIMQQADIALRAAKQDGHGSSCVYVTGLDDRARNRMTLRQSLHQAFAENQFDLHYHPLVDLSSGRIVGGESLVRWHHPDLGLQPPDLFIPLAEASGFIVPLGDWVMRTAMSQVQTWKRLGAAPPRIAINVSSVQLKRPGFIANLEHALVETGANPRDFDFELTEGVLIEASPQMLDVMKAIKSLGFGIAIDDFGTGHATFKYLRDFPIDKIKIDQTFIRKLVIDSDDAIIVRAMIALAHSLGLEIVAEGVETTMQRDFLREEGCKIGQGYLFSLPLTGEDFGWMLQNRLTLPLLTA